VSSQLDEAPADRHTRLARCLDRARDGEMDALADVVRELNPLLWHIARAQGLPADDAIDVVQTTWLELIRMLHDIRSPQALTAWLVTTTRRGAWHARSRLRRQSVDGEEALTNLPDADPEPADHVLTDERDRTLMRHLGRLSARCRQLLRIVAMVDRPDYDEVAEAMRMPRGSVGPTRGRCLDKLRSLLLDDPTWSAG
jgi:RNA polymerase sigma factor (sigma-70 family)